MRQVLARRGRKVLLYAMQVGAGGEALIAGDLWRGGVWSLLAAKARPGATVNGLV